MPSRKINQHREYASKLLPSRLDVVSALYDEELFLQTPLGKRLVELKNHYHDITQHDDTKYIKRAGKDYDKLMIEVMPLVKEAEYLNKVVNAINNEEHSCKVFGHFIENFSSYVKYAGEDTRFSRRLQKHESLLRTIYHKEELEHLGKVLHKDFVSELKNKFGSERAGNALHHYIEAEDYGGIIFKTSKEERLEYVSKQLSRRAYWLGKIARFKARMMLLKKIKQIEKTCRIGKKRSHKLLEHGSKYHKELDKWHKELHNEE